jgi:hypothetical protein
MVSHDLDIPQSVVGFKGNGQISSLMMMKSTGLLYI